MVDGITGRVADAVEADAGDRAVWSGIGALALAVFGLVMAEFLPASVLTPMARDLAVSLGAAGQAVTATAVVGAFAAILVPVLTGAWDRRAVLLGLLALLCLSNLLTALAGSLAALLIARVLLGVALGGFWSMAAATAMRLVPMAALGRAMAIVFTGVTVATVSAAPVGAMIGDLLSWRAAFWLAGAVSLLALACVALTIPKLAPTGTADLAGLADVIARRPVRWALAAVLLIVSGHFAAFTYIRPVLERVTNLDVPAISLALLLFGGAGFLGNIAGGLMTSRDPRLSVTAGALAMAAAMATLLVLGAAPVAAMSALTLWGAGFAMLPVGFQAWVAAETEDKAELGGGALTATFQVAIAGGAVFGGLLVDRFGVLGAQGYCAVTAAIGLSLVVRLRRAPPAPHAAVCACSAA
ncbi:MFS transporter [Sphingosinicella sp. BN140058]|uniref:MFS transporter n=1 Tax=Sphingosinicella sp. BN140058 TaxID=1892855 RepID=UPI001010B18C|nr:MFS transporter [Sphingosinicella sp. BN140058]QAY78401.1 MFS transporter [Sphingosinicella sp. BN140058]